MTVHVQLWSAVPSSWLSFQCCYVKGWSWLVGSCHMTCCALAAFFFFFFFIFNGGFLSSLYWCIACGILKSLDVFISMRRGRAWKKTSASLPLWARIPRVYIWNNEFERAKDAICERPLDSHWYSPAVSEGYLFVRAGMQKRSVTAREYRVEMSWA